MNPGYINIIGIALEIYGVYRLSKLDLFDLKLSIAKQAVQEDHYNALRAGANGFEHVPIEDLAKQKFIVWSNNFESSKKKLKLAIFFIAFGMLLQLVVAIIIVIDNYLS
jgi:hypothetical protein